MPSQNRFAAIILPVRHLHQPEPGECLAACTAMVLTHLGVSVHYQRLFKVLHIQKGLGTPFPNIRELARIGINVTYRSGALVDLYTFLHNGSPIIVPVKTLELPHWEIDTDHAVVVVGMDQQWVYINDPAFARAPIPISHGDFDLAWLERDEYYAVLTP